MKTSAEPENSVRYCLPIIVSQTAQALQILEQHGADFPMLEVWTDYLEQDPSALFEQLDPRRTIVVTRRLKLEKPKQPSSERLRLLQALALKDFWIDLDLHSQKEDLESLRTTVPQAKILLSYHNYARTPSTEELQDILNQMTSYSPQIRKIATQCQSEHDALRLLELLLSNRTAGKIVIQGMGEFGIPVRIFGAIWGNFLTYAPVKAENASAPGQLTRAELSDIFKAVQRGR